MSKYIRQLKRNLLLILKIEIVALFINAYVIYPLCQLLLERVMRSQGYGYFLDNDISGAIRNAWIIITVIGIVLLLGLSSYLEIMILVNTIMAGNLSIKCIFSKSIRSIKRLLSPYGLILILISFFISNIIHFNLLSRIVENLGLIGHLRNIFMNKPVITVLVVSLLLILLVLFLRYLFVYSILSSGNVSVKKSFRLSAKLMESHYFKTLVKLIWVNTLALFFFALLYFIILLIVVWFIKSNVVVRLQYATSMTVMDTVNRLLVFFYSISMVIINIEFSVTLCKRYSLSEPYIFGDDICSDTDVKIKKRRGLWTLLMFLALFLYIQINDDFLHNFRLRTGYNPEGRRTEIFAHRGNSYMAPENTLAALKSAIEEGADGAEIDVRMTKDGELILLHDRSLLRTGGIDIRIDQLNYSQLEGIDVGSWFSPDFKGEKIPTLKEALELSKDELTLMIEVKSESYDDIEIVRRVVENVEEMGLDQDVIIASFNLGVLKEVKSLNSSIATCLILRFAYGDVNEIEYVDMFSVESKFIQRKVFQTISNGSKALAVWTVNEGKQIASLRDMGIDAIITDRPVTAREILYEDTVPGFLVDLISSMLK